MPQRIMRFLSSIKITVLININWDKMTEKLPIIIKQYLEIKGQFRPTHNYS